MPYRKQTPDGFVVNVPQQFIEGFGDEGDLTRQYLLNPTLFALLGDVRDTTILDAGCGQGYLARLLAKQGARVTGIEPADAFFTYALGREQTEQLGIHYLQADLSTWNPAPNSFDVVIANMVLMDIPDYEPAIAARYDAERYASVPGYLVIAATKWGA